MIALRWFLGISAAVTSIGWLLLVVAAHDFRRSFGASGVGAARLAALPLVLLLVLVTVLYPANRTLMHVAAILLALAMIGAAFILRESVFVGATGLLFLALWFVFYWRSVSASSQ